MTNGGKLAREAEIAYATLALVTDYDCWHPDHDSVTVEMVIANLQRNATNAQKVIQETAAIERESATIRCSLSIKVCNLTQLDQVPAATKEKLGLLKKYL